LGVQTGLVSKSSSVSIGSESRREVSRTADTMAKKPAFLFALSDTTQSKSADTHKPISKNNPTPTPKTNALISPQAENKLVGKQDFCLHSINAKRSHSPACKDEKQRSPC
jgi:hypothetical protein